MSANPRLLRIGELADRTGRSADALRYYEREGLIPNVSRDASGHRVYTERHVLWMELLDRLRSTGMGIAQIRTYAGLVQEGDATLAERQALLRAHRTHVLAHIQELQACLDLIDHKVELYQSWLDAGASAPRVRDATPVPD